MDWGTVGEWVGGLAAAGGLFFAGWEIRRSREQRESDEHEHRQAMARSVSVTADFGTAEPFVLHDDQPEAIRVPAAIAVHNGSDYPIDNVVAVIGDPWKPGYDPSRQIGTAAEVIFGTIPAKSSRDDTRSEGVVFSAEPAFGEWPNLSGVLFTDTWGKHWWRAPGVLEARESPPRIC